MVWRSEKQPRAFNHGGRLCWICRWVYKYCLWARASFPRGAVTATFVTWFTFLPSFIFILAGGPFIETTHNDIKFTAPLTAITAAVVGVILNLALFFGYHVLWPEDFPVTLTGWQH